MASFSLYLPAFYHFHSEIKAKKPKPEKSSLSLAEKAQEAKALEECRQKVLQFVPSTPRIAHIAAILANGNPIASEHPSAIADTSAMATIAAKCGIKLNFDFTAFPLPPSEKSV
ncbi:MAG: hypothetical protein ACLPYZ_12305 [Limisphaerales bacterium]